MLHSDATESSCAPDPPTARLTQIPKAPALAAGPNVESGEIGNGEGGHRKGQCRAAGAECLP